MQAESYFAFDLLYLEGRDLRRLPAAVGADHRRSRCCDSAGDEFFRIACEQGLEGIVAKRRDKPYQSGRRPDWQKIKCVRSDSFVIVGYEPSTMPGAIGRLLLAARKGEGLVYVGGCGTAGPIRNRESSVNCSTRSWPISQPWRLGARAPCSCGRFLSRKPSIAGWEAAACVVQGD
ncbi:hypothetical protein [Sinorhizobium fredii]|uniref:ATP-dependent DNA ligase n=1 Tax=Rhizobium fredii TaxID=380 RepID=UPI0031383245